MKTFFKVFSLVFAVLFLWAAYVQYNDPDALLWYAIYGSAALACILFFFNKLPFMAAIVLFALYLIGAIVDWPTVFEGVSIGEGNIDNIEKGRESLGLLINSLVMLVLSWRIKKSA